MTFFEKPCFFAARRADLYSGWIPPLHLAEGGAHAVKLHYERLSDRLEFQVTYNENIMNRFLLRLFLTDKYMYGITLIRQLQEHYGYQHKIPEWTYIHAGNRLLHENQLKQAIELFKSGLKEYPESYDINYSLGEVYEKNNQLELALANYTIAYYAAKKIDSSDAQFFKGECDRLRKELRNK